MNNLNRPSSSELSSLSADREHTEGKSIKPKLDKVEHFVDERYRPKDINELLAEDLPPPRTLIDGVLHEGSKMVIGGGSKSFKTWVLLDLALSIATGAPWWDLEVQNQGRVLYVNFEIQDYFFKRRVEDLMARKELEQVKDGYFHYVGLRGKIEEFQLVADSIAQLIKDERFSLIIIDPIYKALGGKDENSATDMTKLMNQLDTLAVKTGAAVVFGHHFSKGNQAGKDSIDRVSGSGVFARDPDTILTMTKHQQDEAFAVDVTVRNFPPQDKFCVRWEHPLMVRDYDLDPEQLKQQKAGASKKYPDERVLEPLLEQGSMPHKDWMQAVRNTTGMSARAFNLRLKELVERGVVVEKDEEYQIASPSRPALRPPTKPVPKPAATP